MALYEGLFGQSGIYLDVYAVRIDIYGSSAVVGQPLNAGGNQYTCLVYGAKKCFKAAAAAVRHNYCCQQRQVGRANEQSTSLICLWL